MGPPPVLSEQQRQESSQGLDLVKQGLEKLEIVSEQTTGAPLGKTLDESIRITDIDPLSVDLPLAITQLSAQLTEHSIEIPREAHKVVEKLARWAASPKRSTVGEVMDRVSALLLAEGLNPTAAAAGGLSDTAGRVEWTDGRFTVTVAMVFRPVLVDLVARWTLPGAPAAVFRQLGPDVVDPERVHTSVAYAAGLLLPTAPQIRSLVMAYFRTRVHVCIAEQALAASNADQTANVLVVVWRLLRRLPEALGVEAWGWEAPLAMLMGPQHADQVRLIACEVLCMVKAMSDHGRSQLLATLPANDAALAQTLAWLVHGEQHATLAAETQMHRQNATNYELRIWQGEESTHEWLSEAQLSSCVASVGGVLLHAHESARVTDDLVVTPMVARNIHAMALATSRSEPVLLQGPAGSGKTSLVEWVARRTGNELVTVHVSGNMDAKVLLGNYVTTQRAGDFEWRAGLLTTAVTEGSWVLIENIDLAPADVVQTLQPLIESHTLFVASRGQSIRAHEQFRLFATLSTDSRAMGRGDGLLGSSIWTRLEIGEIDSEMPAIVRGAFPKLADDAEALARAFRSIRDIVRGTGAATARGPVLSTRDLVKWCTRLSAYYAGDSFVVFQEAVDVFTLREADHERWRALVHSVGTALGVASPRVEQFLGQHSPTVVATGRSLRIGRATLPTEQAAERERMPFADTRHSRCLLERLATCVQLGEPALLMGETGTGKTTVVQHMAMLAGRSLSVFNLSQQSDASDLLGGFRPVDISRIALRLRESFDALFARTVSVRKNAAFLDRTRVAFGKRDWKRLSGLYRTALKNARQMLEVAHGQLQGAELNAKRQRLAATDAEPKKTRLTEAAVAELSVEWDAFAHRLDEFEAMKGAKMVFSFVEGALVRAARTGAWILLDEVNLATAETLACLGGLLQRERTLLLAETGARITCHADFRLFGCMNPATDVGKRDLPPALRSSFTELFVHAPDADAGDLLAIVRAHLPPMAPVQLCHRVIEFYGAAKDLAKAHALVDGAGQRPHYSLRTLTRSLTYARDHAATYSLRRALYDGLSMTFATQLEGATQAVLVRELHRVFEGDDLRQLLNRAPAAARGADAVLVQGFWLPAQESADAADAAQGDAYVVTRSVEAKLRALARAVMCGRYPVLIQGPTSAGKTSMVQHLARATGHTFVRINNHEHTDLQEYLGAYASVDGRLEFEEGLLVRALRHGHWLVLDELNLAPSDVLEALNRLLDDNRELVIPETQEVVRPHPHFMLFATQNPAGLYGGRKALSRAFRNRFVELHFDDIPEPELQQIIEDSSRVPPTHARLLVDVYRNLTQVRAQTRIFEASHGFITLRDLFRWANRHAASRDELAEHGYMLLAERVRTDDEKRVVQRAIERAFYAPKSEESSRACRRIDIDALYSEERVRKMPEFQALQGSVQGIAWTKAMRRLFVLTALCVRFNEPVLLVGDTGCGKTTVCQMLAQARGQQLRIVNCHQNTESSDILGSQRPVRNRAALLEQARAVLEPVFGSDIVVDSPAALQQLIAQQNVDVATFEEPLANAMALLERAQALFAWHDGPLVQALRNGDMFLMDELNLADDSVLERLNSVLEPARTLVLAENVGAAMVTARTGFGFVATMNPGGDYGKRELSPALRNRFTELWAPVTVDRDDLHMVLCARLGAIDARGECARVMLDFVAYLHDDARVLQHPLSLRDYLFWAEFVVGLHGVMDVRACVVHGACMVLLDGIGAQGSVFSVSTRAPAAVKAECVRQLRAMIGYADMSDLGVVPARDIMGSSDLPSAVVTHDGGRVGVRPFLVEAGADAGAADGFALHAPTTFDNLVKVLRAMQVGKPLLLEGSPGVGKTTLVSTLAKVAGHRLVRINLSDQTDLMDLFGTDLPVDDGFAWCDAPFLQALKRGDWVLLDEINLASQSVLEGLNSCLDHRGSVYISELDREFELSHGFRLFAAQNPLAQGGGRKGLPRSFVNRFSQVFMDELQRDDLQIICDGVYSAHPSIERVLEFNWRMHRATMTRREFGSSGAPWEFNLRDVSRFMELALGPSLLEAGAKPVDEYVAMLYVQRMRTIADRQHVLELFRQVFGRELLVRTPTLHVTFSTVQVGHAVLKRRAENARMTRLRALGGQLQYAESLMTCIERRWMAILVGGAGSGKTALVRWLAAVTGNHLVEFAMNAGVDTSEILGGFEQVDVQRHQSRLLRVVRELVDRLVVSCEFGSEERVRGAAQACALLQQARQAERDALPGVVEQIVSIARVLQIASIDELIDASDNAARSFASLEAAGRFEWVDGVLVEALERGHWLLLDRANLCSASVLDRLNGLLEPNGVLYVNEDPKRTGPVVPHPDFRIIMAVDPQHGELSRAMRNRGIEICMLPPEDELCAVGDQMAVARTLGVGRELSQGVRRAEPSLAGLVQTAVHAAERVQRGYPAHVETADDSTAAVVLPGVQPGALDAAVAVAGWQAQLVSWATTEHAPAGVEPLVWPQRMLLAALSTVQPDVQSVESLVFQAICKREAQLLLNSANAIPLALVAVRRELAQTSHINTDVLLGAPVCASLNLGLHNALGRHTGTREARWHEALQASRMFELERLVTAAGQTCDADIGDLRELVLQRPNIDVPYVQSMFALLTGCATLQSDWESHVVSAASIERYDAAVDSVAFVRELRTVHAMKTRLHSLLEREHGAASEQAVALELMQGALHRLVRGPVRPGPLLELVNRLVLDATHSARMWALVHPVTLPDAHMRELEARLDAARLRGPDEQRAEAVEALAMLYAASARKNKDLIVAAVSQFAASLTEEEGAEGAIAKEVTPASVLADVVELRHWQRMLRLTVVAGSLPRDATAQRVQLIDELRQVTDGAGAAADSPWALLLTRLKWQANDGSASNATGLLSLFADAAYAWYGRLDADVFDASVDAPQHRLGRAVGTELAWRSAARLHCSLKDHQRAASESRALLHALAEFRPSADGEPRGKCAELVAMLLMAARAVGGIDVVTRASERLLAILCGSDVVSRDAVDEWQAELKCADTTGVLEPAVNAVRAALLDSRMASVWVAAVETSIGVLRVAVPGRAVDPAAKAYARWSWLGTDVDVRRADVAAFEAVQRSMTGEHKSAATEPLERELADLERQRAEIELVYRPESEEVRFAELWHEAANLAQSVVGRVRDTAMQLADNALTSADDFTRVQAANEALQKTLQQFELRVEKRYFGAFRDQAQIWTLCSRQLRHALRELGELRRRAVRSAEREQAQLVCALYAQPMAGVPATRESNAQLQGALSQLKTLIYAAAGSPLPVYGELVLALLLRVVLGVQVRGVLAPADLEALDIILRDAYDIHKRAVDERRKREAEAASLFKFKASEDETDERVLEEIFPGFADVFEEEADEPAAPSFADIPDETVAAIAACHQYVMLQFGVLDAAPDVRSELVADAQRQALQLAASLYAARPELAAMATADADSALRGANVAALASVLRAATADAEEVPGAHVTGVRSSRVHDFYHDAWASEAVQLRALALAIAERTRRLLDEWPEHAVLQQIRDMSVRLLELPVTTPLAKLLTGLEQLHERAQDWQAYASRDVSIDELHDAARLIIRWRQRELNSWPHLLRAQELEFARRPNQWWFSLFASLVVPETAGLRELVSAVDQFMQGSPAGEFRARLNMLYAFCEHRAALLAARTRQEEAHSSWADAKRTDSVYAPLANAISYYVQYAPCIASQLETAKQAVSKDLTQYVKISTWKDVNPAALRASAQKTHKHLAKCVRRWREALSQPIFQIIQAQQTNAIVTARVPQVQLVPLPLAGAGVDVEPPRALAAEGALAGASLAPWATNDSLIVDAEVAQMLAQRASGDAVAKVLAGCPATMVQLARLMAASPVFGRMHDEDAAAPTALEQFAVQIVSDVNYFQSVETPKHLVKKPVSETPAQPTSSSSSKKKRIIKNNKKQDAGDEPEYVEEDEERQRLLLRFWGDQRNLRRTRLKEIMKGLQEIGLKRHFRPIADNEGETEDGAGTDEGSAASKPSALTGLTSVLRQAPLDIDGWREAVLVAAAIAPESVHAGSARAQKSWQLADMGFFRLTSQLAQLRTAAFEEHSSEVSAQQVQHIVGLAESLNANVVRDRQSACDLLSRAAAWMQAAAPWAAVASGSYEPTCVQQLKPRVDVLVAQLEQLACAVRAVGDVGGWRDTAGVAHVQREMAAAATLVVQAQALLATVDAGVTAAQLAGVATVDAAKLLRTLEKTKDAVSQTRAAVAAVRAAVDSSAQLATATVLLEPWIEPVSAAAAQVESVINSGEPAIDSEDPAVNSGELADVAGQWVTAVMNVWQAIRQAEQHFDACVDSAELNAWGLAPKELVRRLELAEQLVRALHVPTMLTLCARLTHVSASNDNAGSETAAAMTRLVRPWVVQYSLIVQHVVAMHASAHKTLVQFALTTVTVLASVVVHGLGSNDIYDSEETHESMQSGTGMGEGSTAGAQNVSDEIEGEDQIEGVQGEEPDTSNEPDTNEEAVEMENDFQGAMGDADLETDDEDSDEESDDDEDEPDVDEQMGDVDPTDPTSLDDKLWNDEEEKQESKDEDSKVDSKGQKQQQETDIVAGDEQGSNDQDQDQDQNQDQNQGDEEEQEQGSDEEGSGDEGEDSDGELDDRVNQDTLDRMADVEDQGEQLEVPDELDMGDDSGSDQEENGSDDDDDGLDADMNELPEDEPIEQKPDSMDEDRAELCDDEIPDDDAVEGGEEQAEDDEKMGDSGDEAEDGSIDGEGEGEDEADEDEGAEDEADEDEAGPDAAQGEDALEDERQNSGEKPTHGVDSAMNMDGTDDADPNTAAESRDAVSKPSDASAADNQQAASQSAAPQESVMQPQDAQEQQSEQVQQQSEQERKLNPERTLADVIEKWERRLNIVMRDEGEEDNSAEQEQEQEQASDEQPSDDKPAPESSEFEHIKADEDFDKVALADASEQERDQQEFQPMDIDEQDAADEQQGGEHETAPEAAKQQPDGEDKDDDSAPAQPLGANPQQAAAQRPHIPDAAQMQQSGAGERQESGDDDDVSMGDGSDHEDSDEDLEREEREEVDVEQLRQELEQATAAWREHAQDGERALELWQQYTRLTHDLSLMLTEQLRLILTPTQATQLRGDYRTGKRLNMKRIIPYIASEFRKDKIWLRRTKPARREYQVMVAVDNSKSMAQSAQAVELAYETLALVTTALNQLEVGQLSVVSFGEHVSLLHPFDAPFDSEAGARVLSRFTFADDKTDVVQLMDASLQLFDAAAAASSAADLWRLQLVISDGMCQEHAHLLRQVRAAMEQRIMTVFIVLDRSAIASAGADVDPEKDSIMNTKRVSFVRGDSGGYEIKEERYIDTFPFKYYVVLRDIHGLPTVLAETLRQYFSLVGTD